jgi:hypothetical protein
MNQEDSLVGYTASIALSEPTTSAQLDADRHCSYLRTRPTIFGPSVRRSPNRIPHVNPNQQQLGEPVLAMNLRAHHNRLPERLIDSENAVTSGLNLIYEEINTSAPESSNQVIRSYIDYGEEIHPPGHVTLKKIGTVSLSQPINFVEQIDFSYKPDTTYFDFTELNFDINEFKFADVLSLIKFYPRNVFQFRTIDKTKSAWGSGSVRQVYLKLTNDLISDNDNTIFHSDGKWYSKPNFNHKFWSNNSDLKAFGRFISLVIISECTFPFRFPLTLIEMIRSRGRKMASSELMFFLEKRDEQVFKSMSKINPDDIELIGSFGFDSYHDLIRSRTINPEQESTSILEKYKIIANEVTLFKKGAPCTPTIDWVLSGAYVITPEMIIQISVIGVDASEKTFNSSRYYQSRWETFVKTLTESELKGLMIAFTNSLDINQKIYFTVKLLSTDVEISTCHRTVKISEKLFKSAKTLLGLRIYFQDKDQINEKVTIVVPRQSIIESWRSSMERERMFLASERVSRVDPFERAHYPPEDPAGSPLGENVTVSVGTLTDFNCIGTGYGPVIIPELTEETREQFITRTRSAISDNSSQNQSEREYARMIGDVPELTTVNDLSTDPTDAIAQEVMGSPRDNVFESRLGPINPAFRCDYGCESVAECPGHYGGGIGISLEPLRRRIIIPDMQQIHSLETPEGPRTGLVRDYVRVPMMADFDGDELNIHAELSEPSKKKKKNKKTDTKLESVKLQQKAQQRRRR